MIYLDKNIKTSEIKKYIHLVASKRPRQLHVFFIFLNDF
jgi:hypothetical protein